MTNKLVCHQEGNSPYILLHVSIQGQTAHLAQHPNDYVPSGPECKTDQPTTTVVVTSVPNTTTATTVPTTVTPNTNVVTDSTTPSQIDTQVLAASTVAVPGPIPFHGSLPATGGVDMGGVVLAGVAVTAGVALIGLSRRAGKAWRS